MNRPPVRTQRRDFLLASGALLVAPFARAQSTAAPAKVVGFLNPNPAPTAEQRAEAAKNPRPVVRKLRELGWVLRENLRFEEVYAEGREERLPALAAALVEKGVDVIWALGPEATVAAARATKSIPIVFWGVGYAVELGLVDSFARPGRNVTGVASQLDEIGQKQVELLKEIVPGVRRIANISVPMAGRTVSGGQFDAYRGMRSAARKLGIDLKVYPVERAEDFDPAFRKIVAARARALRVAGTYLTARERDRLLQFAARNRLPGMYFDRSWTEAGGLIAYGAHGESGRLQSLDYIDRILRGARPADLPIEQPNRIELSVNLKTARALGLTVPQSVLVRANQVIE